MKSGYDRIKISQLVFIIISFIQGSVLLVSFVDNRAMQDAWLIILLSFAASLPFIISYGFLAKRFPGKSLIEINDIVFGKIIGKIISLSYILFFLLLTSFNLRDVADFYTGYVMPETPSMVIIVLFAAVCAFAVQRGIGAIAKTSMITTVITVAIVILTTVLLIGDMDFSNFLPVLNNTPKTYVETTHTFSSVAFCEIAAVLVLMPYLKNDKKLTSSMVWGTGIAALIFLVIVVRDIAVLGNSTGILVDNSYSAVKMINIGEFLTRIELFVALNYTGTLFIKVSVLYFVTVSASRQLLKLNSHRSLLILLGSIVVVLAVIKIDSTIDHKMWGSKYAAFFELPFLWILPPLSLLIAKIRKKSTREIQQS